MQEQCPKCKMPVKKALYLNGDDTCVIFIETYEVTILNELGKLEKGHIPHYLLCQGVKDEGFT